MLSGCPNRARMESAGRSVPSVPDYVENSLSDVVWEWFWSFSWNVSMYYARARARVASFSNEPYLIDSFHSLVQSRTTLPLNNAECGNSPGANDKIYILFQTRVSVLVCT